MVRAPFGCPLGRGRGASTACRAYKVRPAHSPIATGTPAFELIAGVAAAVDYLADLGDDATLSRRQRLVRALERIQDHEATLSRRFMAGLGAIPDLRLWGITDVGADRGSDADVRHHEWPPDAGELATELGRAGIFTWNGHFYAQALIERLGLASTGGVLRIGFVHYTTAAEVDRTLEALEVIVGG